MVKQGEKKVVVIFSRLVLRENWYFSLRRSRAFATVENF